MSNQSRTETPLIGITPDVGIGQSPSAQGQAAIFLLDRYPRAILEAGGTPVVLPIISSRSAIRNVLENLDGILVTGGNFDIHPRLYGEEPLEALGEIKEGRTEFELELISQTLERDLPLLGVCGGEQAINVALGGSLYQDIATQVTGAVEHQQSALKEYAGHQVKIQPGTKLEQIVGCDTLEVNTTHHQAVKRLGRRLIANATSADGLIEGIESKDYSFVLGVQWHPESLVDRDIAQRRIYSFFTSVCKEKRGQPRSS